MLPNWALEENNLFLPLRVFVAKVQWRLAGLLESKGLGAGGSVVLSFVLFALLEIEIAGIAGGLKLLGGRSRSAVCGALPECLRSDVRSHRAPDEQRDGKAAQGALLSV